jgi:hypothetical protein
MTNLTTVTNNFENVTTLTGMLGAANAHTGGYTYIALLIMLEVIMIIATLNFGFESAILVAAFVCLISGTFLTYLGLISVNWLLFFLAQIIIMILYITWQKR